MKYFITLAITVLFFLNTSAQLQYTLSYLDSTSSIVKVSVEPSSQITTPVSFIMPRSIPGHYSISVYDHYVTNIYAFTQGGDAVEMTKSTDGAPRWNCSVQDQQITRIEYEVDLNTMERKSMLSETSMIRQGFVGILNYSVFGWIEGTERQPVHCMIRTFGSWPVFSTTQPTTQCKVGRLEFNTESYYTLADGQIFIGPEFRVKEFEGAVPLFIVSYCQTEDEWLDDYGLQGTKSLEILRDYFGELPFDYYSILLIKCLPLEPGDYPAFGMEHLYSSTFFGDTTGVRRQSMSPEDVKRRMPTYLHHMSHAFIPLRCYGDTYRPYVQEIPPIINNIWFNEGFMWFLPYRELNLSRMKTNFDNRVYHTSPEIKKLSLEQLSQAASTMYGADFRLGAGVYSRGALMALEMDDYLKEQTNVEKSMKDVLRYLYQWSKMHNRAFTMEEFPSLINAACSVDLGPIYRKWQLPIEVSGQE